MRAIKSNRNPSNNRNILMPISHKKVSNTAMVSFLEPLTNRSNISKEFKERESPIKISKEISF